MKNLLNTRILGNVALAALFSVVSCSQQQRGMFASAISSTGIVSQSQAEAAMKVGEHIGKAAQSLDEEEEYYLGRGVAATILAKYRPLNDGQLTSYVNKVGAVVAGVSDRPETFGGYHVMVLDTEEINAVSAPGGFIFVTKGFLKIVPDEDALAAVLAHEVAHVVKGHGLKAISEANLSEALILIGKEAASSQAGSMVQQLTATFSDSIDDISKTLLVKGYSRSQEYEADEYAEVLLKRSGYNKGSLHSMLTALENASKGGTKGGWTSTHPKPTDRIDELGSSATASAATPAQLERAKRFQQNVGKLG
jgi:predicted Zn-dependent protease